MTPIDELQLWFSAQCDGDWEHSYGVSIGTLDNPGWFVRIDLSDTLLEDEVFPPFESSPSESRWIRCEVKDLQFQGFGDETRLLEIVQRFIDWAKARKNWLGVPPEEWFERREETRFWNSLGDEVGSETCVRKDCSEKRIRLSVLCRRHHFEMVRGKTYR